MFSAKERPCDDHHPERSPDGGKGLARDTRVRWALEEVGQPHGVRFAAVQSESRWGGWLPLPASQRQGGAVTQLELGAPQWRSRPSASTWPRTSFRFTRSAAPAEWSSGAL